jgi:carbamoyl-phosphate synthase large subunit
VTALDLIQSGKIDLVVNTPRGSGPRADGKYIRTAAGVHRIPCLTTVAAALAAAEGMRDWGNTTLRVRCLQEYLDPSGGEQLGLDV